MKRQRGHMNESNLDTLAVTCTVHQEEIAGEWSATLTLSRYVRVARNPPRIDARRGDPSYKLAYQALAAFPTYR